MGYTHYWENHRRFNDQEWRDLCQAARVIFDNAKKNDIAIVNGLGEEDTEPLFCETYDRPAANEDCISFNGIPDHETCHISRGKTSFDFCKTARKPYDAAVVALLIVASEINDRFSWKSDGDGEQGQLDGARQLLREQREAS